jgi:antigen flippase
MGLLLQHPIYIIRALVMSKLGINAVGYFQVVMTISTIYINVLLNSMLADFFPRLQWLIMIMLRVIN